MLETDRLVLQTWTLADADAAFRLWGDAEVMRFVGSGKPHENLDETRQWLQRTIAYQEKHGFCRWAVVEKASEKIIGSCGYLYQNGDSEIDLGYYFARPFWGQGYATEIAEACLKYGFEKLKIKEIVATVDVQHLASQRVLEKIGFKVERTRQNDDGTVDKFYVAMKREDSK